MRGYIHIGVLPQTCNAIGSIELSKFEFGGHRSNASKSLFNTLKHQIKI